MTSFHASSSYSPGGGGGQRGATPKSRLSGWMVPVAPVSRHLIGWMYFF